MSAGCSPVNDFMVRYPDLEVALTLTDHVLAIVAEGHDLPLRFGPINDRLLITRRLLRRSGVPCVSPGHHAEGGEPVSLADLADHNCLVGMVDH